MNKLSFYEQAGIVIPGAVLVLGLVIIWPDAKEILAKDGFTLGGLGVYLLLAYAAGHMIAAGGNFLESIVWTRGMPSTWVTRVPPALISKIQIEKLQQQVQSRLGISISAIMGMPAKEWEHLFWQLYKDVLNCSPGRVEIFNGNYGLCRGLAVALSFLALIFATKCERWPWSVACIFLAIVSIYRMRRFGIHFAREVYHQFLLLPSTPGERMMGKNSQTK